MKSNKKDIYYVDRNLCLDEFNKWKKTGVISEKLGAMMMNISYQALAYKKVDFSNPHYDDMIMRGVEYQMLYGKTYDPSINNNIVHWLRLHAQNGAMVELKKLYRQERNMRVAGEAAMFDQDIEDGFIDENAKSRTRNRDFYKGSE